MLSVVLPIEQKCYHQRSYLKMFLLNIKTNQLKSGVPKIDSWWTPAIILDHDL